MRVSAPLTPEVALVELPPDHRVSMHGQRIHLGHTKERVLVEDKDVSASLEDSMRSAQSRQSAANWLRLASVEVDENGDEWNDGDIPTMTFAIATCERVRGIERGRMPSGRGGWR